MPELPEVETVRAGLQALLPGKLIASEVHDTEKSFPNAQNDVVQFLTHAHITAVRRRAKVLLIDLSSDYTLVIHLKMTGQLVFVAPDVRFGAGHPSDSLVHALPDTSTRVTLAFSDGSKLFFNDQRKFGWMRLVPTVLISQSSTGLIPAGDTRQQRSAQIAVHEALQSSTGVANEVAARELSRSSKLDLPAEESGIKAVVDFMQKVGPEPLEPDFTPTVLFDRLQRRKNTSIKAALLDQTVLAGVGNIYADESLWGAKIHPASKVKDLSKAQITNLHKELLFVLKLAIEQGGSSNHTYVNAEGKKGSYMHFARVFRREGQACPRCGSTIEKSKVAGRGTHTCPVCQPTP